MTFSQFADNVVATKRKKTVVRSTKRKVFTVKSVLNFNSFRPFLNPFSQICIMRWILVCLLFFSGNVLSQRDTIRAIGASVTVHPSDYFLSATYLYKRGSWSQQILAGAGINRTVFQKRFYPELAYSLTYQPFQKLKFLDFGITATLRNWRISDQVLNVQSDVQPSLKLTFGKRLKYSFLSSFGPTFDYLSYTRSWTTSITFRGTLTVVYVL